VPPILGDRVDVNASRKYFAHHDWSVVSFIWPGVTDDEVDDVARQLNRGTDGAADDTANWSGITIAIIVTLCSGRLGQRYRRPERSRSHDTCKQFLAHVCLLQRFGALSAPRR